MNKEIKSKIVPKLRFPEFKDGGEWQAITLGEFGQTVNGLTGKSGSDFGTGEPYVTYMQVFKNSRININECGRVKIEENEKQNILQQGDVLITTSSETPDEVGFASVILESLNTPIYLNSFCFAYRPNSLKECNPTFSSYLFRSPIYRQLIGVLAQGSTRFNISKTAFLKLKIPIPKDEQEQQKIASCLSSLDEYITAESQKLEVLKTHKKGLMQQLFPAEGERVPKLRFPEFRNKGKWKKKEFNEILEITRLAGYEYSKYWEEDPNKEIIALRGYNIGHGKLELDNLGYISNNLSLKLMRSRLFKGDIVYPCVGTIGNSVVIQENDKYHIQQNIAKLTPKKEISPYFISQFLMSDLGMREVYRFNATSSQPNVLVGSLRKFEIYIPEFEEQEKVASCLSSLDDLITAQTEKIEALKVHKKGLMQGLFPETN